MGDRGGGKGKGKMGNLSYERQIPAFLQKLSDTEEKEGIEGAIKRHAAREEREGLADDREDNEEETPLVVDSLDAMTAKERRKLESGSSKSSIFKGDTSAAAKFQDSAHARHAEWEAQEARKRSAEQSAAEDEAARKGGVVFSSSGKAVAQAKKRSKANKGQSGGVGAKAVRNVGLLSFDEEDEAEG